MRTSRRVIGALSALAVAVTTMVAAAAGAQAIGPDLLPVTVTNTSGRGEAVYLYVLGVNLSTGRLGYVNAGGTFTAWTGGRTPPSPAPDVSIAGPGQRRQHHHPGSRAASPAACTSPSARSSSSSSRPTGWSSPRRGPRATPTTTSCSTGASSPTTTPGCGSTARRSTCSPCRTRSPSPARTAHQADRRRSSPTAATTSINQIAAQSGWANTVVHAAPTAPCCGCSPPARPRARACSARPTSTRTSPRRGTRTPARR